MPVRRCWVVERARVKRSSQTRGVNVGKTLLAQVMEFVPWKTFARIIERHKGDAGVRTLGCADESARVSPCQLESVCDRSNNHVKQQSAAEVLDQRLVAGCSGYCCHRDRID
jgi:hypothetical protein